jgi:hypothetical protein
MNSQMMVNERPNVDDRIGFLTNEFTIYGGKYNYFMSEYDNILLLNLSLY